jgi:hypothetical protein
LPNEFPRLKFTEKLKFSLKFLYNRRDYHDSIFFPFPADFDDTKQKRAGGGNVGLFPFPRFAMKSQPALQFAVIV